ncbi:putative protein N(5)-glutamine methyltransferase [Catelliglobosispora koreensis]|uniref:putative protein N(5)-glutamine methyltransferase n=1 Tax=Catelliglobosispora koreensis TaxID=129052 RepID=UPI000476E10C|nr:putative protein N(5)-glutamine methyltransferase [Catelliglobosispora koreensis]
MVKTLRTAGCVFAEDEAQLILEAARTPAELDDMVARRVSGLPLEHIVGWAEFCGLRIAVDPGVFIPRRRTEALAREALKRLRPNTTVFDLGCGSGAVGAVLRAAHAIQLFAVDIDPAAVACARRNLGDGVYLGDLYDPLPKGLKADLIVANIPYVPTEAIELMPAEARLHENRVALDGGPDGLDVLRRVAEGAPRWLAPQGFLLTETSRDQACAARDELTRHGLTVKVSHRDGSAVVIGQSL